jgi:hypothetical protein
MHAFIRGGLTSLAAASLAAAALAPAQANALDAPWRFNAAQDDASENALMLRIHQPFGAQRQQDAAPRLSLSMAHYDADLDARTVDLASYSLAPGTIEQRLESPFIYRLDGQEGGFFSHINNVVFTVMAATAVVLIAANANDDDEEEPVGCGLAQDPGFALSTQSHRDDADAVFSCFR